MTEKQETTTVVEGVEEQETFEQMIAGSEQPQMLTEAERLAQERAERIAADQALAQKVLDELAAEQRASAEIAVEIEQTQTMLADLAAEREQIVDQLAANLTGNNQTAEKRLPVIAAKQEAAHRRLQQLQVEQQRALRHEQLQEYARLYEVGYNHYLKLKEIDEQLAELNEQRNKLIRDRSERSALYDQIEGNRRISMFIKLSSGASAEENQAFSALDSALQRRYRIEGYF